MYIAVCQRFKSASVAFSLNKLCFKADSFKKFDQSFFGLLHFTYLCSRKSVSYKKLERFAKQIGIPLTPNSPYKSLRISLFASSITEVSREAR